MSLIQVLFSLPSVRWLTFCLTLRSALSPSPCYPPNQARAKIAGMVLVPVALIFTIVPAHVWSQIASAAFGIGFFGQPLLIRAARKFVQLVPDWKEKIDLRNSIFSKVPTNAQLVLHCLRVKEAMYDPLPAPPPPPSQDVKDEIAKTAMGADTNDELGNPDHSNVDNSDDEHDEGELDDTSSGGVGSTVVKKTKKGILSGLKLTAKKAATFKADVTVAGTKAKVGNKIDRMLYQGRAKDDGTPESFPAKMDGASGHLLVHHRPGGGSSTLSFVPLKSPLPKPTFSEEIGDLVECKKSGVFIGRAVLGWASGVSLEGAGLEMRFKPHHLRVDDTIGEGQGSEIHDETHEGKLRSFSHVGRRDQLFARLISIGTQKFETL